MKIQPAAKSQPEPWHAVYLWLKACGSEISMNYCKEAIINHPYYPALPSFIDFLESGGMKYQVHSGLSSIHELNYPLLAQIKYDGHDFMRMITDAVTWGKQNEITKHGTSLVICPEKNARWQFEQRKATMKERIMNYNVWTTSEKNMVRTILKILSELSQELNIDLILDSGTLLGHIRHGGIMAWDDDADLAIEESHFEKLMTKLQKTDVLEHSSCLWSASECLYHKFWLAEGEPIENHKYRFPFVDLWIFTKENGNLLFRDGRVIPGKHFFPLKEVEFEYTIFKIPRNADQCLTAQYPGWKKEIRIFEWSHRLEKWHNYPLSVKIKIGANGELVIL